MPLRLWQRWARRRVFVLTFLYPFGFKRLGWLFVRSRPEGRPDTRYFTIFRLYVQIGAEGDAGEYSRLWRHETVIVEDKRGNPACWPGRRHCSSDDSSPNLEYTLSFHASGCNRSKYPQLSLLYSKSVLLSNMRVCCVSQHQPEVPDSGRNKWSPARKQRGTVPTNR